MPPQDGGRLHNRAKTGKFGQRRVIQTIRAGRSPAAVVVNLTTPKEIGLDVPRLSSCAPTAIK
jgi:hypothetical protein